MKATELQTTLEPHVDWLRCEGGSRANLAGADLAGANLVGANLSEANLSGADLHWANLSGADLSWADLRRADLSGARLSKADLHWANLSWADLCRADLSEANLSWASLGWASLSGASLPGADLSGADLHRADLSGANLRGADLSEADLSEADLFEADLSGADLSGADLSGAKGLRTAREFMAQFDKDAEGWLVYKAIGKTDYAPPENWAIEVGAFLEEVVNPLPTLDCACGVNFGTLEWCQNQYPTSTIWRCRIAFEAGPDIVVPYATAGKARCGRLQLLEKESQRWTNRGASLTWSARFTSSSGSASPTMPNLIVCTHSNMAAGGSAVYRGCGHEYAW